MDLVADDVIVVVVEDTNGERAELFSGIPSSIRMQNEMIVFVIFH